MELLSPKAIEYAESCQQELEQLLLTLCRIPAPSHQEDERAKILPGLVCSGRWKRDLYR